MKCPNCGHEGFSRIGLWPVRLWRRFARRNVYACHRCMSWWRSPRFEKNAPIQSGLSLSLKE